MHDQDYDDDAGSVCRVGNHRHNGTSALCDRHLDTIRTQLAAIARYTRQLPYHLMPGTTPPGDRVSTSRTGSPTPGRLDVLSLSAAGNADVRLDPRLLHQQVRQWSTVSTLTVRTIRGAEWVTETRRIPTWHSQIVTDGHPQPQACQCGHIHDDQAIPTGTPEGRPMLVMDSDQVGLLPPAEWADEWVRKWRLALGRTRSPIRGRVDLACDADQRKRLHRATIGEALRKARQSPALMPAVAHLITVQRAYATYLDEVKPRVRAALLGIRTDGPHHQARVAQAIDNPGLATPAAVHDSVAAEWAVRYGTAQTEAAVEIDCQRLAEWVELAADAADLAAGDPDATERVDIGRFAGELRALHAELARVVGVISDDIWLGRCPALLRDTDGEETDRPCGYGLWQDPYRTVVECGRCRSMWPRKDWLGLAALIRTRWPYDRRRRYTALDRHAAETSPNLPRCTGCMRPMRIDWRDSTARRERTPYWTPTGLACPAGCLASTLTVVGAA